MAKAVGILSCDPGWRGLAFTLYIPSLNYTSTRLLHLNYTNNKAYKRPVNTIPLLVEQVRNRYWSEEPRLCFVDKIILESQHKLNMQQLSWLIHTVLLTLLPSAKIEYISPLKCKRLFNVPLGKNWQENKNRMLEYVQTHKDELIAGNTVTTHDTADSIILLNTYLKEKKRRVCITEEEVFKTMQGVTFTCPTCNQDTGSIKECQKGQNAGKYFLTCANYKNGNKCGFKWLGTETPELIVGDRGIEYGDSDWTWPVAGSNTSAVKVGNKRKAPAPPPRKQPPSKVAASGGPTQGNLDFVRELKKAQEEFYKRLPAVLEAVMKNLQEQQQTSTDDIDGDPSDEYIENKE